MKVLVMVKATKSSESGALPSEKDFAAMGKFNEELVKAGVLLAAEGLLPSSTGKRVRFHEGARKIVDGPFTETKELVAGFWILQVKSMDEALQWIKKCPDPMPGEECEIELRPIASVEDLGETFTPELRAREERIRAQVEQRR